MSAIRDALTAAGLPVDPTDNPHFRQFWYIRPRPVRRMGFRSLLTAEQVRDIRRRYANGERQVVIGERYGIAQSTVSAIVRYEAYAHVGQEAA